MDKIPVASEEAAHVHAVGYAGSSPAVPHRGNTNKNELRQVRLQLFRVGCSFVAATTAPARPTSRRCAMNRNSASIYPTESVSAY